MEELYDGEMEVGSPEDNINMILDQWRQEYGAIYFTDIEEIEFVWRELSRSEYKRVLAYSEDDAERQEFICRLCVLEPMIEDYSEDIYAGFPQALASQILTQSGFSNDTSIIDRLMAEYDHEMQTFDNQVGVIIKEIFPEYTLEDIEGWGLDRTLKYYSRAKWALEHLRGRVLEKVDAQT